MTSGIIRAADCLPQPWKNGMGVTREIARFPVDADNEHFLWRVSVAEVNSAAPFSAFPGIDRHIALLDGAGFTMTLDGTLEHPLHTPYEPFAFAGEAHVDAALVGGPTRDFNLMVRRAQAQGSVAVCQEPGSHATDTTCALLYVLRGTAGTAAGLLQAGDAWRPNGGAFVLYKDSLAFVVRVIPRAD
ncbi:HutD/Ves family protein [Dyella humicola]|uniref:HutD/Ves family protein n=1 Tax=Dyella humicola TaxID=2992126 RepID=UPI0022547AE0|nr:HutD family protein [Dyella humicola]